MTASRLQREQKQRRVELVAALRVGDKFCCLGVACDKSKLGMWVTTEASAYVVPGDRSNTVLLPDAVRNYYGFRTIEGYFSLTGISRIVARFSRRGRTLNMRSACTI